VRISFSIQLLTTEETSRSCGYGASEAGTAAGEAWMVSEGATMRKFDPGTDAPAKPLKTGAARWKAQIAAERRAVDRDRKSDAKKRVRR